MASPVGLAYRGRASLAYREEQTIAVASPAGLVSRGRANYSSGKSCRLGV